MLTNRVARTALVLPFLSPLTSFLRMLMEVVRGAFLAFGAIVFFSF